MKAQLQPDPCLYSFHEAVFLTVCPVFLNEIHSFHYFTQITITVIVIITSCCRRSWKCIGNVTKKFRLWIKKLGIMVRIGLLKTKLLGTVRILRKELGFSVPGERSPWLFVDSLPWDEYRHDNNQSSELNGE